MDDIVIAEEPADSPDVRACFARYVDELAASFGYQPDRALPLDVTAITRPRGLVLLARRSGEAVGCGALKLLDGGVAEVKRMWVSPTTRGQGLGGRLLAALEDAAVAEGRILSRLETNERLSAALELYRSRAYEVVAPFNAEPFATHWLAKRLGGAMDEHDRRLLRLAIEVAARARANGNHPFGAVLASASGEVLMEAENTVVTDPDVTAHAELNLVRAASGRYRETELAATTLYSSTEPCAMCSGGIYWSGIGRVVYALSEAALGRFTGADPENPTMHLSCRTVLAAGQRVIAVEGPADLPEAAAVHEGFWDPGRAARDRPR